MPLLCGVQPREWSSAMSLVWGSAASLLHPPHKRWHRSPHACEAVACRYCRIVAAEVLSFMIPTQLHHPALSSLALLQPLMRLITIYHEPGVRLLDTWRSQVLGS